MYKILILLLILAMPVVVKEGKFVMGDEDQIARFLSNISEVESTGGQNTDHPEIQTGIHAGDQAIGRYGLMPNTVKEVINRMRLQGTLTPEIEQLNKLDHTQLKETLEANPQIEDQLAGTLANRVLHRQHDEDKAAFSWNMGHNLKPEQIDTMDYKNSDYVKKYNAFKKLKEAK